MNDFSTEQWFEGNQRFLSTAIRELRTELQQYLYSQSEQKEPEQNTQTIDHSPADSHLFGEGLPYKPALNNLVELFGLSSFERKMLLLCAGIELDGQFAQFLQSLRHQSAQVYPSFSLALSAFPNAHWSALTPEGPLNYWRLIEVDKEASLTNSNCRIDESILHYLVGFRHLDHRLRSYLERIEPVVDLVSSHQKIAEDFARKLARFNETGYFPIVYFRGNTLDDDLAIAANAFATYGYTVYRLPAQLLPQNAQELTNFLLLWNRAAILNHYALFLDASSLDQTNKSSQAFFYQFLESAYGFVMVGGGNQIAEIRRGTLIINTKKPESAEQHQLWKQNLNIPIPLIDETVQKVVTQFDFDAHSIKKLAQLTLLHHNSNGTSTPMDQSVPHQLWTICCNHTRPNLEQLAQRIEPLARWDDLVLPKMQKAVLKAIVVQVQQRRKVYQEWGFGRKSHRGLGISALFAGESGTGKTMASEVLANELQLDLFRIDLSQVVNKYIGETEKNLGKIFDSAEESGAILLFDEADALFGKRSEVKDSHDRYSNIEVSYLLQKMEEYRGLAILTTNMRNALDKAFLRRLRFVVQFPFPDAQMRMEIWKRIFPRQTPTEGLKPKKLAALNIAGGNIKNIALNAAFAAAGQNQPVTMQAIQEAALVEYNKLEKQMSAAETLL